MFWNKKKKKEPPQSSWFVIIGTTHDVLKVHKLHPPEGSWMFNKALFRSFNFVLEVSDFPYLLCQTYCIANFSRALRV